VHPFQHTTWLNGAAASGRRSFDTVAINFRAEVLADRLESTSLTFGRYQSRTLAKIAVVPEKTWTDAHGTRTTLRAGVAYDDTNRDRAGVSPVAELIREFSTATLRRASISYTKTTQVPTYTALNSSAAAGLFRGNPNLGRQASHNLEAGIAGTVAGWSLTGGVFWRRDDSLVDWTFLRGVTARTANPVDIDVAGLEIVTRKSWDRIDVVLGYTALTKDADYRGAGVDASFYALNYARHRFTAAFTLRLGREWTLRLDNVARVQAANLLRLVGGDDAVSSAIGLSYRPRFWPAFEAFAQVDNLWDSSFQDIPAVPAASRQGVVGVSYAW
jgi:outer membrane cobalamin receptor